VSEQHAAVNIIVGVHDRLFGLQQTQGALADNAKHHQPELEFTVEGRVLAENMSLVHKRLIESNMAQEEEFKKQQAECGNALFQARMMLK
jgi:hypothetical protein